MRLHILGICGTFMAGVATLARCLGHRVSGSDAHAYPPMSEVLAAQGIAVYPGYHPRHLQPRPDCVVIGNALSRGNPAVEFVLDQGLAYVSGPAWLRRHLLVGRTVAAVAGTHGKTTTASLLAWILEHAGLAPGFLIGGLAHNFDHPARLGGGPVDGPDGNKAPLDSSPFVVEADEYDTAFFDKRAKFVHYPPRTLIINNIEYDHADIYPDLGAVLREFHHLVRIVPPGGLILRPVDSPAMDRLMDMGCWSRCVSFGINRGQWQARNLDPAGAGFEVFHHGRLTGRVRWSLIGRHNVRNGLAAIAAATNHGVPPGLACEGLAAFAGVRRRLELRGTAGGVYVYDDFAHHPTAIRESLAALRAGVASGRILAVLDPASNTMSMGVHRNTLGAALAGADEKYVYRNPRCRWDVGELGRAKSPRLGVYDEISAMVAAVSKQARPGDHVLVMSNGAFGGIHQKLLAALAKPT